MLPWMDATPRCIEAQDARRYDPAIIRFASADSVIDGEWNTQGWNRYSYVHGIPIAYKNPTGHEGQPMGLNLDLSQFMSALKSMIPSEEVPSQGIAGGGQGSFQPAAPVNNQQSLPAVSKNNQLAADLANTAATVPEGTSPPPKLYTEYLNQSPQMSSMDKLQFGLDMAGMIPGVGEPFDMANALISLGRGNYIDAALGAAAMVPFAGWGSCSAWEFLR